MKFSELIGWPTNWADWSGIVLFVFAGAQVWLAFYNEARARKEREVLEDRRLREKLLDEQQREHIAYGALYVEYIRMWSIALQWQKRNLVEEAILGLFEPGDIVPRDWSGSARHLGELGRISAQLGGGAYTMATQAESCGRKVVQAIEIIRRDYPALSSDFVTGLVQRPNVLKMARDQETRAKWFAREAELLFKDAIDNSRPGKVAQPLEKMVSAGSQQGKVMKTRLDAGEDPNAATLMPPMAGEDETI